MIQKLRELMQAHPFHEFFIALADGRRFTISSPDMAWLANGGRGGLHIHVPADDRVVMVNPFLISSVEIASPSFSASEDQRK